MSDSIRIDLKRLEKQIAENRERLEKLQRHLDEMDAARKNYDRRNEEQKQSRSKAKDDARRSRTFRN